jgi:predicted Zn finger-like uncharacterized protein
MILQCDQCNTRFRLDESKLKPGGVKVRCSKCRHIFLAGAEQKFEESEFDSILSGLGSSTEQTQQKPAAHPEAAATSTPWEPAAGHQAPAAATPQSETTDFTAFDFADEPSVPPQPAVPVPEEETDFGAFSFDTEEPKQEAQPAAASHGLDYGDFSFVEQPASIIEGPGSAPGETFEFGEFSFSEEPLAISEEPLSTGGGMDFGALDFSSQPAAQGPVPSSPANDALDFGEVSFAEEPVEKNAQTTTAHEDFEFGDFSFEEPAVKSEEPAALAEDAFDFGDINFEEPTAKSEQPAAVAEEPFDFGEFSFSEEPAFKGGETGAVAKDTADFGEVSFAEEPAAKDEVSSAAAAESFDFAEFSFDEEPAAKGAESPSAANDPFDFGEFSFSDEPPPLKEEPVAAASADRFTFDEALQEKPEVAAPVPDEFFSLGEFSFSGDFAEPTVAKDQATKPEPKVKPAAASVAEINAPADAAEFQHAASPASSAAATIKPPPQEPNLDFSFPPKTAGEEAVDEEELPPLAISSRRKGRSWLTISMVVISVLVVVALSGAGLYLLQSGPAAMEKFDKVGLGFVAKWFGMEIPEEGRITIKNPLAAFHANKEAGEIFVVNGEVVNSYKKARASIHVKVSLFDKNGAVVLQKTAYCGNKLSDEQLSTLPMAKIESIMNNQFGDSLANLGVQPGHAIGFVVAIANVPKEAVDFGVEVVGSTVAGQ